MKNDNDFEKFCEYIANREKAKFEVMNNNVDWDNLYEKEDSLEDIIFNF